MANTSQNKTLQSIEVLLTCPICIERMKNPKHLPCQHAFCEKCLGDWTKKCEDSKSICCPVCRKMSRLSKDSEVISPAITVTQLLDIVGNTKDPPECSSHNSPAATFCKPCNSYLCASCLIMHTKDQKLFHHMQGITPVDCLTHSACTQDMFCTQCHEQGCRKCMKEKHQDHSISKLSVIAEANKVTLKLLQRSLRDIVRFAKQKVEFRNGEILAKGYEELKNKIDAHCKKVIQNAQNWKKDVVKDLQHRQQQHAKEMSDIENNIGSCGSLLSFVDRLHVEASDHFLLNTFSNMSVELHKAALSLGNLRVREDDPDNVGLMFTPIHSPFGSLVAVTEKRKLKRAFQAECSSTGDNKNSKTPKNEGRSRTSEKAESKSRQPFTERLIGNNRERMACECTFDRLSKMTEQEETECFYARNIPWYFSVRIEQGYFACILHSDVHQAKPWSCMAEVQFTLLNRKPHVTPVTRNFKFEFPKDGGHGCTDLIRMKDLLNPKKGYIMNDEVTVRCEVHVTMQKGIRQAESKKMSVHIMTDKTFADNQGSDLYDPEFCSCHVLNVEKTATLGEFMEVVADCLQYPVDQLRPWPFVERKNQAMRPEFLDVKKELESTLDILADDKDPWVIFLETPGKLDVEGTLPKFSIYDDVLLFFKQYDPWQQQLIYRGYACVPTNNTGKDVMSLLNQRAGFLPETALDLYEETGLGTLHYIDDNSKRLEDKMTYISDGDIIVFQKKHSDSKSTLPSLVDFFRKLQPRDAKAK